MEPIFLLLTIFTDSDFSKTLFWHYLLSEICQSKHKPNMLHSIPDFEVHSDYQCIEIWRGQVVVTATKQQWILEFPVTKQDWRKFNKIQIMEWCHNVIIKRDKEERGTKRVRVLLDTIALWDTWPRAKHLQTNLTCYCMRFYNIKKMKNDNIDKVLSVTWSQLSLPVLHEWKWSVVVEKWNQHSKLNP